MALNLNTVQRHVSGVGVTGSMSQLTSHPSLFLYLSHHLFTPPLLDYLL